MTGKETEVNKAETLKSPRKRLDDLTGNPWFWLGVGLVAAGGVGVGTRKIIKVLRSHRQLQKDSLSAPAALNETLEGLLQTLETEDSAEKIQLSRLDVVKEISSAFLESFRREEKGTDLRGLYATLIHPLISLRQKTQDLAVELSDADSLPGLEGVDFNLLRRLFSQIGSLDREVSLYVEREYRHNLETRGYKVLPAPTVRGRDWQEIAEIMEARWGFPTFRQIRHGVIQETGDFGPESLIFPEGWLVVKRNRKVVGYVSFIPLEYLDPDQTDFESFSFENALTRKTETLPGNTLMITSVTKDSSANTDAVAAGILGLIDLARKHKAANILAPALSPFVKREIQKHGGTFTDWWSAVDEEGLPKDSWRLFLSLFTLKELGTNERFMEFNVKLPEVITLLGQNRNIKNININDVINLLKQETLFLDVSPVPLQRIDDENYQCIIPAGWLLFYDQKLDMVSEDRGPELYRMRLPLLDD